MSPLDQSESYVVEPMARAGDGHLEATIPATYTDSPFPLQYYFVLRDGEHAWRYPDLAPDLANQAYLVVRQHTAALLRP